MEGDTIYRVQMEGGERGEEKILTETRAVWREGEKYKMFGEEKIVEERKSSLKQTDRKQKGRIRKKVLYEK